MQKAHLDFETRSVLSPGDHGTYRYAKHPTTYTWGFAYQLPGGPEKQWRPGWSDPQDLLDFIAAGGVVCAHNYLFELLIWNHCVRETLGYFWWPELKAEQMDCTMSRAAAVACPQGLEKLALALQLTQQKDMEGSALMKKMAKPRGVNPDGTIIWWDAPELIDRNMEYCVQDIRAESEADLVLPPLSEAERQVWLLDYTINARGIPIDVNAVTRCNVMVDIAKKEADKIMRRITDRMVPKCSSDKKIIEWINSRGVECTTVKKGVQDDLIFVAENIAGDTTVRDVIQLRASAKKTSTAKYQAMLDSVEEDGRIRGLLNYHGAATGRWAGRGVQPQNLSRLDYDEEGHVVEWIHDMLANPHMTEREIYDAIAALYGESSVLSWLSRLLRSMIKAPSGYKFCGGDFSNIEGRINAWFADETWKLNAFREYDADTGPDLYNLAYALAFGVRVEDVTKVLRQIGKVMELALGYQGSVGAFMDMGANYNLDPYKVSAAVIKSASAAQWDFTAAQYAAAQNKEGLQEREWTAIKILVDNWRKSNPSIVQSWWDYQDAAVSAVSSPGTVVGCARDRVKYYSDGRCLWCMLPSGRMICYMFPSIEERVVELIDKNGNAYERVKRSVSFWGYKEGRWKKLYLYGGLQCENIVQGTARDVMVDRMFEAERRNYPIILTVHDELLTLVQDIPDFNSGELQKIMSVVPPFVEGLPLAAKAWEDMRYVK